MRWHRFLTAVVTRLESQDVSHPRRLAVLKIGRSTWGPQYQPELLRPQTGQKQFGA
jgi:hypothetical protein